MRIVLMGPYVDDKTKAIADKDLIRIGLTNHKTTGTGKALIGQGRISDQSVLLFHFAQLNERERREAEQWAAELLRKEHDVLVEGTDSSG